MYNLIFQEDTTVPDNKDPFSSLNGPADAGGNTFDHNDAFSNGEFELLNFSLL